MKEYTEVAIHPNPLTYYAILSIPGAIDNPYTFQLLNEKGNKVKEWSNIFSNKFIINGQFLKPGRYFYKLFCSDYKHSYYGKLNII